MGVRSTQVLVAVRRATNLSADDTQKTAVAARVRLNRYLRAPWIAVAAGIFLLVQRKAAEWLNRDSILLFALLWVVAIRLLAGLPSAAEKISVTDMLTHQTRAVSVKMLSALGLFFLAGAAFYGYLWFATAQWREFTPFVTIFSGGFAIT
jgi:hypothetical protein